MQQLFIDMIVRVSEILNDNDVNIMPLIQSKKISHYLTTFFQAEGDNLEEDTVL